MGDARLVGRAREAGDDRIGGAKFDEVDALLEIADHVASGAETAVAGIEQEHVRARPALENVAAGAGRLLSFCSVQSGVHAPPPSTVERLSSACVVKDASGHCLAYVDFAEATRLMAMPGMLTGDEARRIAAGIRRCPIQWAPLEIAARPTSPR